jgi:hypothetical protein
MRNVQALIVIVGLLFTLSASSKNKQCVGWVDKPSISKHLELGFRKAPIQPTNN